MSDIIERSLELSVVGVDEASDVFAAIADQVDDLQERFQTAFDGMTATGSGKSMVSVPWIGKHFGVVNFILGGCGLDKRKYPMRTEVACGLKENISIKMTGGFAGAVSMPRMLSTQTPVALTTQAARRRV